MVDFFSIMSCSAAIVLLLPLPTPQVNFAKKGCIYLTLREKHKIHIKILLAQQNLTNEFVGSEISVSRLDPN